MGKVVQSQQHCGILSGPNHKVGVRACHTRELVLAIELSEGSSVLVFCACDIV